MKSLLPIILIIACINVNAQDNRWSVQVNVSYNNHLGQFSHRTSNNLYLGQTKNSIGGNFVFLKPIHKGFGVGLSLGTNRVCINNENVQENLRKEYNPNGEYFMTIDFKRSYLLSQFALELFKNFSVNNITVRPFVRLGIGNMSDVGSININLKKRNDNYFETYSIRHKGEESEDEFNFFYPSFGTAISFPINNFLEINTGLMFSAGKVKKQITISENNLFEESNTTTENISQTVSSFTIFAGLQLKFGRRK